MNSILVGLIKQKIVFGSYICTIWPLNTVELQLMQNFRKIKQLHQKRAEKQYAMSELQIKRKAQSAKQKKQIAQVRQSCIEAEAESEFFVIKNLDNNKIERYKSQMEVEKTLLDEISELPQIDRLLYNMWEKYQTEMQQEEQQFLEACYQGDVKNVQKCVNNKTKHPLDPKKCLTDENKNGIHLATSSGSYRNLQIIRVLADYGVDINGRTIPELRTPLMLGAILGNQQAVEALLKLGADKNAVDFQGNTALHFACIYNQVVIARILLNFKVSIKIKNQKNQTPLDLSRDQLLKLIVEHSQQNEQAAKEAGYLLESRFEHKAQMQTEEGGWSGVGKPEKVQQVAIKDVGLSTFKKLSMLGRGAFGQVFLAQNTQTKLRYAVKMLDKRAIMSQNILRYAMTERKILSTISHPFIVKLKWAFQTQQKLYLVMDYCPGGDLLNHIKKNGVLSQETLKKYMAEIVLAIDALHRAQIIYRDLKPSNIIIDSEGHACLTDFGLSKQASLSHSFCGSVAYLAPEMLWRRGHTKVLDWYLLGVVIYECLTGRPPFWDSNKEKLLSNIKSGRYRPLSSQFSRQVKDLVEKLLRSNHSKRLGFNGSNEIKNHPWFAQIDWRQVQCRGLKMPQIEEIKGKVVKQQCFVQDENSQHQKISGWDYSYHSHRSI